MVRALIRHIVDSVAAGQKYHLKVVFSDGTAYHSTQLGDPDVTIVFYRRAAEWRMVLGGMFEFLDSYFEGDVDIVGDQGLRRLVNIGYRKPFGRIEHPWTLLKRRLLEWQQNNRNFAQAKRNATFHYGLPTEFFRLVLGETLGYSEGFWKDDTRTLEEAQHNSFDLICRKLRLNPGDKLIEVGPGWGYLSMLAAQKYGADVTSYGLVASQNKGMRELMKARGFDGKLTLVEKDHRELANEPATYDRFVSVGVQEHAGRDCSEHWIRSIAIGLRPGGIGLISSTFNMQKRPTNYATIKHISRRLYSEPRRDTDPHGEIWPGCPVDREHVLSLPSQRGLVAEEFRDALGADPSDRPRALQRKVPQDLAFLPGRFRRNVRSRTRDHQLLSRHVRERAFRAPWPVRAARQAGLRLPKRQPVCAMLQPGLLGGTLLMYFSAPTPTRSKEMLVNTREQYVAKFKAQLDQWNAEVAKWEAKSRSAQADMRIEYERQLDAFRRQRDHALEQMHMVQAATGDAWTDLVHGADDAWAKLRAAFEKAHSHFRK